jgi:gas vesicle protein
MNMNADTQDHRSHGFAIGLLTGTVVGAGLVMWLSPRMRTELGRRVTDSARNLGDQAIEHYERASHRVVEAADDLTRTSLDVRDDVADAVARGAREVERYARAVKSDRIREVRKPAAADRPASTVTAL